MPAGRRTRARVAAWRLLFILAGVALVAVGCGRAPASTAAPATETPRAVSLATPSPASTPRTDPSARPTSTPPLGPTTKPLSESSDPDLIKIDWGQEITPDEIIAMGTSGKLAVFEWHIMPNIVRVTTTDDKIFHMRNERYGKDMIKSLQAAGVKMGKDGIPIEFSFCN